MGRIRRHASYANIAATLALVLAMSGGAMAATGGFSSGGTLRACVNEEGAIRLLKAGKSCKKGQKAVSWNETGPAGAKGAAGTAGPAGASGPAGAKGTDGAKGKEGPEGQEGQEGAPGTALAYASYEGGFASLADGTLAKNLTAANLDRREAGVYCLKNLGFVPQTAMVSANNSFGTNNIVASVTVVSGISLSGCAEGETVRIRTVAGNTGALTDGNFNIWLD
jgi:collagen triple helix repeat protein